MDDAHVRQTRLAAELGRSVERALVELAGKEAAGAQHVGRRVEQAAEDIEAVGTALERQIGLKVLDLVRQRAHDSGRNVRRVGDEHVEGAPLVVGNGTHQVGEAKGDVVGRETKRIAVFGSKVDGGLCVQQGAFGRIRFDFILDCISENALSGGIHGRVAAGREYEQRQVERFLISYIIHVPP